MSDDEMLGRRLNSLTQCWEAPGLVPISVEVMCGIKQPGATLADLVVVLRARDRAHAAPGKGGA